MHRDPTLPQTPSGSSRGSGVVPGSTVADGGEFRPALERALDPSILNRRGADASATRIRGTGPGSVREFTRFEHGAGI